MFKRSLKEIQQKDFENLTAICSRPGASRLAFAIELANELSQKGETVCFCSFSRTKENLQSKLLQGVLILNAFPADEKHLFKRLNESARVKAGAFVLVDHLTVVTLKAKSDSRAQMKMDILAQLKEIATKLDVHIIVTDTFSHASNTDDMLPIPIEAQKLCDRIYILYKDVITEENINDPDACMLKLKVVK